MLPTGRSQLGATIAYRNQPLVFHGCYEYCLSGILYAKTCLFKSCPPKSRSAHPMKVHLPFENGSVFLYPASTLATLYPGSSYESKLTPGVPGYPGTRVPEYERCASAESCVPGYPVLGVLVANRLPAETNRRIANIVTTKGKSFQIQYPGTQESFA
eukprot:3676509-Rhodomonas_salina.1